MSARKGGVLVFVVALVACGPGNVTETTGPPMTTAGPTGAALAMWDQPQLQPVAKGTYFVDPDLDPATTLRVVFDIPTDGWSQWAGTFKAGDGDGHVAVSITTVNNLVSEGCSDHAHAEPPVGPTVDDLATALANLGPFQVTSAPEDVTAYGYGGKHLEWAVPDLPVEPSGDGLRFTECTGGQLKSWVAPFDTTPGDAFYGYTGPGYTEEFWILDVDGTRLMIAAERSAGSPQQDLEELITILDSIRIEP
jgi:hypothetical protein